MTIQELNIKLKELGINEDEYYLHGLYGSTNDDDKIALVIKQGTYSVEYETYFKERGEKHSIKIFNDENDACQYIYKRLKDIKEIEDKYLKQIYNLKNDSRRIKLIQEVSLDKKSYAGYKIENDLLFGTKEWFNAIQQNIIPKHIIKGVISRVYMSGHNDYPEFEIENNDGKTTWTREGINEAYKVGKNVELIYVEQRYKRPTDITGAISKCVIEIKIG